METHASRAGVHGNLHYLEATPMAQQPGHTRERIMARNSKEQDFATFLEEQNIRFRREYMIDFSRAIPGTTFAEWISPSR
jgi:hypothetical protein